jgi:nucleoid-associated protein YgaU
MMRAANSNPTGNPMSNPTPNSPANAAQAAAQAAQAALQAAKAKSQATALDNVETNDAAPTETDEQLAKAWGFASKRPRLSKEAVIGLVAIIALLAMFSYVVARHFQNRAAPVADKSDKVDPDVKPASNSNQDPFADNSNNVAADLDELENSSDRKPKKGLNLDDEMLDIGDGQAEPQPTKVAAKKQPLPMNLDDEFDTFGDDARTTTQTRTAPKTAVEDEAPEFGDEPLPQKTNRATVTLDFDDTTPATESEQTALTKTNEPIRLKRPAQPEPADDEFQQPLPSQTAKSIDDDFQTIPQRAQRNTRVAQKDMFAENTRFDDPQAQTSPTTDLPPARERTSAKPASRHPLLKEGEYLVEEGDNFCVISKKLYGSDKYFLALAEHNRNRVADPCRMRPGLIISAPAKEALEQQHSALIPKAKPAAEAKGEKTHSTQKVSAAPLPSGMFHDANGAAWYRVGKGDTLTGIAQAHLGRVSRAEQIFNLNRERLPNRDDLRLGQELRLPNDASQVRLIETEKSLR